MPTDKKDNGQGLIARCPYCEAGISDEVGIVEHVESKYSLQQWTNTDLLDSETEFYFCLNCRESLPWDFLDKVQERVAAMQRKEIKR